MVHSSEACLAYRLVQTERTCYSSSVGSLRPCNLPPRGTSVIRSRTDCSPYNAPLLELAPHCAPLIYASIRARFGLPTYPPPPLLVVEIPVYYSVSGQRKIILFYPFRSNIDLKKRIIQTNGARFHWKCSSRD